MHRVRALPIHASGLCPYLHQVVEKDSEFALEEEAVRNDVAHRASTIFGVGELWFE